MTDQPKLVMLPGLLCDEALFAPQRDALGGDYRVRIPDLTREDSVGALAQHVLDTVEGTFALAGLSMGGYVALEIMRRAPERVTHLALIDTQARADSPEQVTKRRGLIDIATRGRFKGVTPRLLPLLVHPDHLVSLGPTVMEMAARVGQAAFIRQETAILTRPDSRPDLPNIKVPTLVIAGAEDQITPVEVQEEMASLIPEAEIEILPDCGHLATLEKAERVSRALRVWLRR